MKKLMVALLVTTAFAAACGKSNKGETAAAEESAEQKESDDSTGVPECDKYFKAIQGCAGKMPAEAKKAWQQAQKAQIDSFKQMTANAATRDAAKSSCKQALDALKTNPSCG